MIESIAIDDEPVALDIIKNHAEKAPMINLKATFLSATEALSYIQKEHVDLIFLDINMPDISGREFVNLLQEKIQVIFTTAYPEYALAGFDLAVSDYLLKPINFSRFLKACMLVESRLDLQEATYRHKENFLLVKDGYQWVQIRLDKILYIESQDNYVSIVESDQKTVTRMTLAELERKLPKNQFVRVQKSFIVSLSSIEKIERHQLVIQKKQIPISLKLRDFIVKLLNS